MAFGIAWGYLVYFLRFGIFGPRKIWQPCRQRARKQVFVFSEKNRQSQFPHFWLQCYKSADLIIEFC
jgi:hypothetical protein